MTAPKHTPTPWLVSSYTDGSALIFGPESKQRSICSVSPFDIKSDANAKFIVHAVNLHDDLVKALKALAAIRLGDLGSDALESFQSTGDVFDFTADVLHRAKEGQ